MKSSAKKVLLVIAACLLLFCLGFSCGYLFDRIGSSIHPAGAGADVGGYDEAAGRIERAASAVGNAAGNVREAAGEVRISIDEAGSFREIARDIGSGTNRALDGLGDLENGIQRVMGIMDAAEKRNAEMETAGGNGMD